MILEGVNFVNGGEGGKNIIERVQGWIVSHFLVYFGHTSI